MPEVDVHVDVAPQYIVDVHPELLERAAREAANAAHRDRPLSWITAEMSLRVTGDEEIRILNRDYRHVDHPTDVLSFAFLEGEEVQAAFPPNWPTQLGEVVVSYPYAQRQSIGLGHSTDMEIAWLVIHGTLQLLGYSHETDARAEHMEGLERQALRAVGFIINDPEP